MILLLLLLFFFFFFFFEYQQDYKKNYLVTGDWSQSTSTLVGHFVSSPRDRENRDRRDSGEMKEKDRED